MVRKATGSFRDIIIHPGETLKEALEDRGITQKQLAKSVGMTEQHISRVIQGRNNISGAFARKLEYALGIPASFWMNLQRNYDLDLAEYEDRMSIKAEEYDVFKGISDIIEEILSTKGERLDGDRALGVMQARRELRVASLLNIPSIMEQVLYRKSKGTDVDEIVTFAWQRLCECYLDGVPLPDAYDERMFEMSVEEIKLFMFDADFNDTIRRLREFFLSFGIRFVVVKHYRGAPVHGMARKNMNGTVDLCLTIRGSRADIFWFSLFHEVAHILHGDFANNGVFHDEDVEKKADDKAADLLISAKSYSDFVTRGDFSWESISALADRNGVPEYIVIGRLQNDGHLPWQHHYSSRIPRYKWL